MQSDNRSQVASLLGRSNRLWRYFVQMSKMAQVHLNRAVPYLYFVNAVPVEKQIPQCRHLGI